MSFHINYGWNPGSQHMNPLIYITLWASVIDITRVVREMYEDILIYGTIRITRVICPKQ